MPVRHVVEAANVDQGGFIVDPTSARHCVIRAGALLDLSGPVDPLTHLNTDFPYHALGDCVIAERLEAGAPVLRAADGKALIARVRPDAICRRGRIDVDARRLAWLEVHRTRRNQHTHAGH